MRVAKSVQRGIREVVAAAAVPAFFARIGPYLDHSKRSGRSRMGMPMSARANKGVDMGYRDRPIRNVLGLAGQRQAAEEQEESKGLLASLQDKKEAAPLGGPLYNKLSVPTAFVARCLVDVGFRLFVLYPL